MFAVSPRLLRVPPYERGITLGDFFVPVRVGERASSRQRNLALVLLGVGVAGLGAGVALGCSCSGKPSADAGAEIESAPSAAPREAASITPA